MVGKGRGKMSNEMNDYCFKRSIRLIKFSVFSSVENGKLNRAQSRFAAPPWLKEWPGLQKEKPKDLRTMTKNDVDVDSTTNTGESFLMLVRILFNFSVVSCRSPSTFLSPIQQHPYHCTRCSRYSFYLINLNINHSSPGLSAVCPP